MTRCAACRARCALRALRAALEKSVLSLRAALERVSLSSESDHNRCMHDSPEWGMMRSETLMELKFFDSSFSSSILSIRVV